MINKKLLLIVVIMLLVSSCVFGASTLSTTNFKLKHTVNVDADFHFEFWNPSTSKIITEASFEESGRYVFATLVIVYNSRVTLKSVLSIEVSDLTNTDGDFYPFSFAVLKPNSTDSFVDFSSSSSGHGAGTAVLLSKNTVFTKYSDAIWDTDEICDFAITLDDSETAVGEYSGTIKYIYTGK